jgi:hypothetical protein
MIRLIVFAKLFVVCDKINGFVVPLEMLLPLKNCFYCSVITSTM